MFKAGATVGPYTLITKLGRGAFGVVWLAERRTTITTTKVALKIPFDDDVDLDAVKQEADLWVRASGHPNVLPIIEADIYDGQVIIASEYAPEGSLEAWLNSNGGAAPTIGAAMEMTLGILAGLEHLHSRKIIHRDLKPANLLLQGQVPRLADFGISRILKSTSQTNSVAGTPVYMAPEAFDGTRNEQTDLWSAGVILYQMLSGTLPFPGRDMTSLIGAILSRNADPLPVSVPEPLHSIVHRSLDKDVQHRYRTAHEMRTDLRSSMDRLLLRDSGQVPQTKDSSFKVPSRAADHKLHSLQRKQSDGLGVDPRIAEQRMSVPVAKKIVNRPVAYAILGVLAVAITFLGIVLALTTRNSSSPASSNPIPQTPTQLAPTITREQVEQMIEGWRSAWERGDLALYSTYYDVAFSGRNYSPNRGYRPMSREEWIKDKSQKLRQGQIVSIHLGPRAINHNNNEAVASFIQSYRSTKYSDTGQKTLHIRLLPTGELKIFKEDFIPKSK